MMKARFDIFRKKPDEDRGYRQIFELEVAPGQVVLEMFHRIQERIDPSFAYRYSCRGAICGSCAVRINGTAALACKTQVQGLAEKGTIVIDPLTNLPVIKDLVCEFTPFWEAYGKVRPYLDRALETHDDRLTWEDKVDGPQLDELRRCGDCIKCGACFSDCPKRAEDPRFIGPAACVQLYKFFFDPRDGAHDWRMIFAFAPGGVLDCDRHANCVKVCPKDVRPLRAINFMRKAISSDSE